MNEQPSEKTVIVTATREVQVMHHLTDSGDDLLGIFCEDETIGEFYMALSVEQAKRVAMRMTALLCALPEVRAAAIERKDKEDDE